MAKLKQKPNVGTKGGDYIMPISFRKLSEAQVLDIQNDYRTRFYSQKDLSTKYGVNVGLINKVVRVMEENLVMFEEKRAEKRLHKRPRKSG